MHAEWILVGMQAGALVVLAGLACCLKRQGGATEVEKAAPKFSELFPLAPAAGAAGAAAGAAAEETVEETEANRELKQVEEEVPDSGRVVLRRGAAHGAACGAACGAAHGADAGAKETKEATGFEYWADRSVSYPNLEALARKWVLVYKEPEAYVARRRVLEARPAPTADPVFASLKTYSAPTVVKVEQANVYRWRGKVREVPRTEPPPLERPTLRYGDFKKNV